MASQKLTYASENVEARDSKKVTWGQGDTKNNLLPLLSDLSRMFIDN